MTTDNRDVKTEAWLDSMHVTWTYEPKLSLDDIDVTRSLANQARLEPLDEDTVDRYTADMRDGAVFPAVIAHKPSARAKKLVLLGGNHRRAAATAAKKRTIAAYIVTCEPETATLIAYTDNRRHGLPSSRPERIRQAVHLVEMGMTGQEAAKQMGVSASDVSNYRAIGKAERRARTLGVDRFDHLPVATKLALSKIDLDAPFRAASELAVTTAMTNTDAAALVKQVAKAASEADALATIGEAAEERRHIAQKTMGGRTAGPRGRAGRPSAAYGTVNGACVEILGVSPEDVAASIPPASVQRIRERCKETARRLMAIDKALGAA